MPDDRFPRHPYSRLLVLSVSLIILVPFIAMGAGCSTESNPDSASGPSESIRSIGTSTDDVAVKSTQDALPSGGEVSLREADTALFQQVLEASKGKVVLVDLWATWCVPCKRLFPKMVKYGKKYAKDGLVVVSVSIDDQDSHDDALQFLRSVKATGTNLRSKWGVGTESAEQFDFSGEVPFYKLYDRNGKLRYQFTADPDGTDGVKPLEQLELRIMELLLEHQP